MSHRLADKTYISTGQMLILMFDFILGNAVIIFTEKKRSLVVAFLMILCAKRRMCSTASHLYSSIICLRFPLFVLSDDSLAERQRRK